MQRRIGNAFDEKGDAMSPELFSGILAAILVVVAAANIVWNKKRRNRNSEESPAQRSAKSLINSYADRDSDSRFVKEFDLVPFKILSEELGMQKRHRPTKRR